MAQDRRVRPKLILIDIKPRHGTLDYLLYQMLQDDKEKTPYPKYVPDEGDEEFIRVLDEEEEKTKPNFRTQFWNVEKDKVDAKTASKMFHLDPNESHVFNTKTLINVFNGAIKITYNSCLADASEKIIEKVFQESMSHTIYIEARKNRPITISQAVGLDTAVLNYNPLHYGGVYTEAINHLMSTLTPDCERRMIAEVRVGWLKEEYAEDKDDKKKKEEACQKDDDSDDGLDGLPELVKYCSLK